MDIFKFIKSRETELSKIESAVEVLKNLKDQFYISNELYDDVVQKMNNRILFLNKWIYEHKNILNNDLQPTTTARNN